MVSQRKNTCIIIPKSRVLQQHWQDPNNNFFTVVTLTNDIFTKEEHVHHNPKVEGSGLVTPTTTSAKWPSNIDGVSMIKRFSVVTLANDGFTKEKLMHHNPKAEGSSLVIATTTSAKWASNIGRASMIKLVTVVTLANDGITKEEYVHHNPKVKGSTATLAGPKL
jgi:hypothetical protein